MTAVRAQGAAENDVDVFGAGLTVGELRVALQNSLRQSGALRALKTQLRGYMLTNLLHSRRAPVAAGLRQENDRRTGSSIGHQGEGMGLEEWEKARKGMKNYFQQRAIQAALYDVDKHDHYGESREKGEIGPPLFPPTLPSTWPGRIADCLIHNHLLRSRRDMSLAIFATEAEVPPLSDNGIPVEEEQFLRQLLGLPECGNEEEEFRNPRDSAYPRSGCSLPQSRKSALHVLVEEALYRRGELEKQGISGHRHQCGIQTEDFTSPSDQTNPMLSMECRLAAIDAKYALVFSQQRHGGAAMTWQGELERRMAQYKEDLHQLLRAEYQQKYRSFEQTTLQEAKEKWEMHNRQLREHMEEENREKQRTMQVKNDQERMRLSHMREDLEQQRLRLEKKQLEMIAYQQECETQVDALQRQGKEMRDKLQSLKFQCEKWEELCATRLEEAEAARVREMRRTEELRNAKADHAVEIHVLEEELHHLRFRLHMLSNRGINVSHINTEGLKEEGKPVLGFPKERGGVGYTAGEHSSAPASSPAREVSPPFSNYANYRSIALRPSNADRSGSPGTWPGGSSLPPYHPSHDYYSYTASTEVNEGPPFSVSQRPPSLPVDVDKAAPFNLLNSPSVRTYGVSIAGKDMGTSIVQGESRVRDEKEPSMGKYFGTLYPAKPESADLATSSLPAVQGMDRKLDVPAAPSATSALGGAGMPVPIVPEAAPSVTAFPPSRSSSSVVAKSSSASAHSSLSVVVASQERKSLPSVSSSTNATVSSSTVGQAPRRGSELLLHEIPGTGLPPVNASVPTAAALPPPLPPAPLSPSSSPTEAPSSPETSEKGVPPTSAKKMKTTLSSSSSSLLEQAAEIIRRKLSASKESSSSSSSSSTHSSHKTCRSSSSSTDRKRKSSVGGETAPGNSSASNETALRERASALSSSEAAARISVENEEEESFKGILWAARSQRTIIQAKEDAKSHTPASSTDKSSSSSSNRRIGTTGKGKAPVKAPWELDDIAPKTQQRQEPIPMFTRDSDDDDDSILYQSSSGSSF